MLGKIHPHIHRTTIIGAGLSGLIAAYKLIRAGHEVEIFDGDDRVGGLIKTLQTPYGIVETAAHSIRATPYVASFLAELGVPVHAAKTAKRAIHRQGKNRTWPLSVLETLNFIKNISCRRIQRNQTILGQFGRFHLGNAAADHLLQPMANGIFATPIDNLDYRAAFPDFDPKPGDTLLWHAIKGVWRTRRESKPKILTPQLGMGHLVHHLEAFLQSSSCCRLSLNAPVEKLPNLQNQNIIVATPAPSAARLLKPVLPELADLLAYVVYQPLVTVTLFYKGSDLNRIPRSLGVLNSPDSTAKSLGILFNSSAFDNRIKGGNDVQSFTMFLGETTHPDICALNDQKLEDVVSKDAALILGAQSKPVHQHVTRCQAAIPVLSSELVKIWQQVHTGLPQGLCLFANYAGSYSIRQMIHHQFC